MLRLIKVFLGLCFGILVLWGGLAYTTHHYMENHFIPLMESSYSKMESTKRYRFINDLKTLDQNPPFPVSANKSNAVDFLNQHISWNGKEPEQASLPQEVLLEKLYDKAQDKYSHTQGRSNKLLSLNEFDEFDQIDTNWMTKIDQFDHWNFFQDQDIKRQLKSVEDKNFLARIKFVASYPIPKIGNLLKFAQVRFLREVDDDPEQAYKNYYHTLTLIHSSHSLVSAMVAALGLRDGYHFKKTYPVKYYSMFNLKTYWAYRRVSWGWVGAIDKVWSQPLDERIESFMRPELGACTAISEQPLGLVGFSDFAVKSDWPLEHNFEEPLERARSVRQNLMTKCRFSTGTTLLNRQPAGISFSQALDSPRLFQMSPNDNRYNILFYGSSLPYIRRIVMGVLTTTAIPYYTGVYEDSRYRKAQVEIQKSKSKDFR